MSVINDMLKDLDDRRDKGEASVPVGGGTAPPRRRRTIFAVFVLSLALAALALALAVRFAGWQSVSTLSDWVGDGDDTARGSASADVSTDPAEDGADREAPPAADTSDRPNSEPTQEKNGDGGAATSRLADVALERETGSVILRLQLSNQVTGVEHEHDGSRGELVVSGARLGEGVTLPAADGTILRSLSLSPSDGGLTLRYRTVADADVGIDQSGEGSQQRLTLEVEPPPSLAAEDGTPEAEGNVGDTAADASSDQSTGSGERSSTGEDGSGGGNGRAEEATAESADATESSPQAADATEVTAPPSAGGEDSGVTDGGPSDDASGEAPAAANEDAAGSDSGATNQISRQRRDASPGEEARAAYKKALEALESGDTQAARDRLASALASDPAHAGARRALAMIHLRSGESEQAAEVLRAGFDNGARTPALISLYARSWLERGDKAKAVAIMEEGRETLSVDAEYLATMAAMYQQQGRFDSAAGSYREALRRNRQVAGWWAGFGIALENSGDQGRAAEAYERALTLGGLSDSLTDYVRDRRDALE